MGKLCVAGLLMMALMIVSIADDWDAKPEIENCEWNDALYISCPSADEYIFRSGYCDGEPDCTNGADEPTTGPHACKDHKCNPFLQFDCGNGKCIHSSNRCNVERDCDKDSATSADEIGCPDILCTETDNDGVPYVVNWAHRCDGVIHCKTNGEDEADCLEDYECDSEFQFKCRSGNRKCIPKYELCDCHYNCDDGSDEGAFCGTFPWPFDWQKTVVKQG